ncbi:MAG: hypothetical protein V1750_09230 [Acidobacteriota bacterium]
MELPAKVQIYSQILSLSGALGTLMAVRPEGYYELHLPSQGKEHTVFLPVTQTGIAFVEAELEVIPTPDVER